MEDFILGLTEILSREKHSFKNVDALIKHLRELQKLVGMTTLKEEIINFIQFVVINNINRFGKEGERNMADNHFINMVLSGDPGCGKTTAGNILCKIIGSLNLLKNPQKKDDSFSINNFIVSEVEKQIKKQKAKTINELQKTYRNLSETVNDLKKDADEFNDYYSFDKSDYKKLNSRISRIRGCKYSVKNIIDFYEEEKEEEEEEEQIKFTILKRADLVGQYVGHTAIKTRRALDAAMGGVVLLDEAYSIINADNDPFGMEALTVINETLSQHPDEIAIIFAGYENMLNDTIFHAQPGLKRRIGWTFHVDTYSTEELKDIFVAQVSRYEGWKVVNDSSLLKFFNENKKSFPHFGGDTEKLLSLAKQECYSSHFKKISKGEKIIFDNTITVEHLEKVIGKIISTSSSEKMKEEIHNSMYL